MAIVRKRKANRRRGAAAVEAALVMPIMLLVTLGAIKYGWLFLRAQQVTTAARYGARVAVRADAGESDVRFNNDYVAPRYEALHSTKSVYGGPRDGRGCGGFFHTPRYDQVNTTRSFQAR